MASASLSQVFGVASHYPSFCMIFASSGQGISGMIPSLLQFYSQRKGDLHSDSLFVTSFAAILYASFSILCYFYLLGYGPSTTSYQSLEQDMDVMDQNVDMDIGALLYEIRFPFLSVLLNMLITLLIFPSITSHVESIGNIPSFVLFHFLCYNLADWVGKSISLLPMFHIQSPMTVFIGTLLRILFIPAIMCCNVMLYNKNGTPYPHYIPVLFSDSVYFCILFLFAFTNGIFDVI
jgi:hypothetical protein